MYLSIYVEINLICFIMLGLVVKKKGENFGLQKEVQVFRRTVLSVMLIMILDSLWILSEYRIIPTSPLFSAQVNALYMADTGLIGYLWFSFTEAMLKRNILQDRKWKKVLLAFPCVLLAFLSLASIFTGWIFYVDENNVYHRGTLYAVQLILAYSYLAVALVESV